MAHFVIQSAEPGGTTPILRNILPFYHVLLLANLWYVGLLVLGVQTCSSLVCKPACSICTKFTQRGPSSNCPSLLVTFLIQWSKTTVLPTPGCADPTSAPCPSVWGHAGVHRVPGLPRRSWTCPHSPPGRPWAPRCRRGTCPEVGVGVPAVPTAALSLGTGCAPPQEHRWE